MPDERGYRALVVVLAGLLVLGALVGFFRAASMTGQKVSLDPNEGWNAYHAQAAMTGRDLYPKPESFVTNNYPPLSFFVVGPVGRLLHDDIEAGRIFSLLSFLAMAGGIGVAARKMGAGAAESTFGASLFAAIALFGTNYVGMNDPQLLGHAIDILGLLVVLRDPPKGKVNARSYVAAFLFVLALFIKHNLVALPLAVMLWLAIYDRRRAVEFGAAGIALALIGLAVSDLALHVDLLDHLRSARLFGFGNMAAGLSAWSLWGFVPAIAVLFLILFDPFDRAVVFLGLYGVASLVLGAYFLGGAGVDQNAMFDADIALALGVSLSLQKLNERAGGRWAALGAAALLAGLGVAIWQTADPAFATSGYWLQPLREEQELAEKDIAFVRSREGPALCETLALCYWAGKKAEVDVFNLGQRYATHTMSDASLVALLAGRRFAMVEFDPDEPFPLTPRVHRALSENYRVDHSNDDGTFFVPR